MVKRAEVISVKELSRSIDQAVTIAAKRHGVTATGDTLAVNWEIIGRIMRDLSDVNVAFQLATDITKGVKVPGIQAQPAIAKLGGGILVGFIERAKLPKAIGQ